MCEKRRLYAIAMISPLKKKKKSLTAELVINIIILFLSTLALLVFFIEMNRFIR